MSREPVELHAQSAWLVAQEASRQIPPLWPIAASVAVNPFLGQLKEDFATTSARLAKAAGTRITMPRSWYAEQYARHLIIEDDLLAAIVECDGNGHSLRVSQLVDAMHEPEPSAKALPTVADLAFGVATGDSGQDWPAVIEDRIGRWAADHFDIGQALWAAPRDDSAYAAWRGLAIHDLTPEIHGLHGFASHVAAMPASAFDAVIRCTTSLGLPNDAMALYFHRLWMSMGGWSQLARQRQWLADRDGREDDLPLELLAIRLAWEEALLKQYGSQISVQWAEACKQYAEPVQATRDQLIDASLQLAADKAAQRRLFAQFEIAKEPVSLVGSLCPRNEQSPDSEDAGQSGAIVSNEEHTEKVLRPSAQWIFCIDVRSEPMRRAIEFMMPEAETLGFAGFFGIASAHRDFGSRQQRLLAPVLVAPGLSSSCEGHDSGHSDKQANTAGRVRRAWGRFTRAAVSSFAYVEAAGLVHAGSLLQSALNFRRPEPLAALPKPELDPTMPVAQRVELAAGILRAMSLTRRFAPSIVIVGHGSTVANNPHAAGLQCGACGGQAGDVNARLLAGLLNDVEVREGLISQGISIPSDTTFVAAQHDTASDEIVIFDHDIPKGLLSADALASLQSAARFAGERVRTERAARFNELKSPESLRSRGLDWSEPRHEWGLAGCQTFILADRSRSSRLSLGGRSFLHSYRWRDDPDFTVLESALTAPVTVASWISLQYFGSTVAPEVFGAGNKLLHNVVGGVGVLEGNGAMLRAGLARQSIHDGERFVHEPVRMSVLVEAPRQAVSDIVQRHQALRELFDHNWLHLFVLDEQGLPAWRYRAGGQWSPVGRQIKESPAQRDT